MGRPRKIVDMQSAHNTKDEKQKRKQEERYVTTGRNQLKTPPKWMINDVARKEWRRIVKELNQIDIVGNLDYSNLGGYCNAYANYIKVTEAMRDQDYCIEMRPGPGRSQSKILWLISRRPTLRRCGISLPCAG